jgi:hypothetical protein
MLDAYILAEGRRFCKSSGWEISKPYQQFVYKKDNVEIYEGYHTLRNKSKRVCIRIGDAFIFVYDIVHEYFKRIVFHEDVQALEKEIEILYEHKALIGRYIDTFKTFDAFMSRLSDKDLAYFHMKHGYLLFVWKYGRMFDKVVRKRLWEIISILKLNIYTPTASE